MIFAAAMVLCPNFWGGSRDGEARILAGKPMLASMKAGNGLARTIDKKARTYSVHLEIDDDGVESTSDYNLELRSNQPKKGQKEEDKPKPGSYLLRLTDLRWKSGDLSRREAVFGSGTLIFSEHGFPSEFLTPNWILAPFLGFYVPDADAAAQTDLPLTGAVVGDGWKLSGKARLEAAAAAGQDLTLSGTLSKADGTQFQLSAQSTFDPKTGWPKACQGTVQRGVYTVTYTAKLR